MFCTALERCSLRCLRAVQTKFTLLDAISSRAGATPALARRIVDVRSHSKRYFSEHHTRAPSSWNAYSSWQFLVTSPTVFVVTFVTTGYFFLPKKDPNEDSVEDYGGDPLEHVSLSYGEMTRESIDLIISDLQIGPQDIFYDLGSGIGNVCIQVFQQAMVRKAVGIEIHDYRAKLATNSLSSENLQNGRELIFLHENFMNSDLSDATVIFTHSLAFHTPTLRMLAEKVSDGCPNLRYFVTTKALPEDLHVLLPFHHKKKTVGISDYAREYYVHTRKRNLIEED